MKRLNKLLSIILSGVALGCLIAAAIIYVDMRKDAKEVDRVLDAFRTQIAESTEADDSTVTDSYQANATDELSREETFSEETDNTATESTEPEEVRVVNPYADTYLANRDMAGWLQIPGTVIDYPVMWTPGNENFYLYRDFNKKDNNNGSLILDTDSCLDPLSTNLIIHGHNMKSGAMFGDLTEYEKKDYYEDHKRIILYTPECQRNYEVIAVFRSQVYKKTDDVFKFYQFFDAGTEEEFLDFYNNIKKLSLYDTGVTAEFGDHFITLSTCVYHVTNGRFVVVAKEVEGGDLYLPLK